MTKDIKPARKLQKALLEMTTEAIRICAKEDIGFFFLIASQDNPKMLLCNTNVVVKKENIPNFMHDFCLALIDIAEKNEKGEQGFLDK